MTRTRRTGILALLAAVCLAAAVPDRVKPIEVEVDTPVYRLPPDLPVLQGEQHYRLHWSGVPVARVRLAMTPSAAGALDVEILGATHPVIDWLWRYRFEGHGRVRTDPFGPGGFVVDECENRDHQRTEIRFDQPDGGVLGIRQLRGRTKHYVFHSDNTFDLPSSVYLLLNLDYAPGRQFALDAFTGKSRYLVRVAVEARETLAFDGAPRPVWRLRVETEELTDDDPEGRHRETLVWVTEERPRRLLRATSRTFVGAIHLELEPAPAPGAGDAHGADIRGGRCA
ncbi:MAG: DUF3108 domain-containing protein [Myxococcota bacterium]